MQTPGQFLNTPTIEELEAELDAEELARADENRSVAEQIADLIAQYKAETSQLPPNVFSSIPYGQNNPLRAWCDVRDFIDGASK